MFNVLTMYRNFGVLQLRFEEYAEAVELFQKALDGFRTIYGPADEQCIQLEALIKSNRQAQGMTGFARLSFRVTVRTTRKTLRHTPARP